jgi:hypothetical protein
MREIRYISFCLALFGAIGCYAALILRFLGVPESGRQATALVSAFFVMGVIASVVGTIKLIQVRRFIRLHSKAAVKTGKAK